MVFLGDNVRFAFAIEEREFVRSFAANDADGGGFVIFQEHACLLVAVEDHFRGIEDMLDDLCAAVFRAHAVQVRADLAAFAFGFVALGACDAVQIAENVSSALRVAAVRGREFFIDTRLG